VQRTKVALVLIMLVAVPSVAWGQRKSTGVPRFDAAVSRGAQFLIQNADPEKTSAEHMVLAAYALFKAGLPVESPQVQEGLRIVLGTVTSSGFRPHNAYDHLYESGLFAMFLADVDAKKYQSQIQTIANYVISVQRADGSWSESAGRPGDVSMCQYAVLALWAAQRAGCTISPQSLDRVVTWLLSSRNQDGGWSYRPGTTEGTYPGSTRSTTMAVVSSLGVTRLLYYGPQKIKREAKPEEKPFGLLEEDAPEQATSLLAFPEYKPQVAQGTLTAGIERGLAYETSNFNPVHIHSNFPIYFYYSTERALSVAEIDSVAGQEWYVAYGDGLLSLQAQSGAWNESRNGDLVGTSFAVLYFMRSTKQIFEKQYGLGLQAGRRGNPFGDKGKKREPTELDLLIGDLANMKDFEKLDETPVDFADEIVRSVLSIDDPKQLVGQTDKLKSLIRHPKPDVRKAAYWALGRTGDFGLIPLMLEGVKDPDVDVNVEAIAALRYIARKPNGLGESLNPLDGVPENDTAQRIRAAVDWRQKTIKLWSNWYASVRPYEEIGSFDELQLAVPVDAGAK
jgi:hypothetical protein